QTAVQRADQSAAGVLACLGTTYNVQLGDHDVGLQTARQLELLGRRAGLTDDAEPRLSIEQRPQRLAKQPLGVDQDDPIRARLRSAVPRAGRASESHCSRVSCAVVCNTA